MTPISNGTLTKTVSLATRTTQLPSSHLHNLNPTPPSSPEVDHLKKQLLLSLRVASSQLEAEKRKNRSYEALIIILERAVKFQSILANERLFWQGLAATTATLAYFLFNLAT